jgi:nitrogen fixation NifU-like protein
MNYSKEVLKHFSKPHNYGKIENYDVLGRVGNMTCGDEMFVYIKVKDNIIKDINLKHLVVLPLLQQVVF